MIINPYEVLGVGPEASADEIRQRYLTLVRQFPPEREPQRFAQVRAAYDQLRDPIVSLERRLFNLTATDTFDTVQATERQRQRGRRLPTPVLLSLAEI